MRLCFLGDVAVERTTKVPSLSMGAYDGVIANLEGPILRNADQSLVNTFRGRLPVYSTLAVLDVLHSFRIVGLSLANNHIYDLPLPSSHTRSLLEEYGILTFGAGKTLAEASKPLVLKQDATTVQIFGFGWRVIGCRTTAGDYEGVNPLSPGHMLATIRELRRTDTTSFVVFFLHWNYELERYPQPAHRQLAHDLIAEGVDMIIGTHPHVSQGMEIINDRPIVYSLGNWYFPPRIVNRFRLHFPEESKRQLAFEVNVSGRTVNDYALNWYQFDANTCDLTLEARETNSTDRIISELSPFINLSHSDYTQWFSQHRARRRGLPVYRDYRHTLCNHFRDQFVLMRHFIIRRLISLGLKRTLAG